jgi:hypothetical protein
MYGGNVDVAIGSVTGKFDCTTDLLATGAGGAAIAPLASIANRPTAINVFFKPLLMYVHYPCSHFAQMAADQGNT